MSHDLSQVTIAIVGARGLVGQEALAILEELDVPPRSLRAIGSERSVGETIAYCDTPIVIESLEALQIDPPDYVILCADAETAIKAEGLLRNSKTTIIDNSSAFRMNPEIPLVIPEVNGALLDANPRLVANPNCSTIMLLTALNPLRSAFGVRSINVSTYQAVSGAGRLGLDALHEQTRAAVLSQLIPDGIFPVPCAFDVFEHESAIDPLTGLNGEESKMIAETRKIWNDSGFSILPTCVRVPVQRAHAQAVTVELNRTVTVDSVQEVLKMSPGVRLAEPDRPLTPASVSGLDDVHVGRIRIDPNDARRVLLWICCDQVRKGAALNAIQILLRLANRSSLYALQS